MRRIQWLALARIYRCLNRLRWSPTGDDFGDDGYNEDEDKDEDCGGKIGAECGACVDVIMETLADYTWQSKIIESDLLRLHAVAEAGHGEAVEFLPSLGADKEATHQHNQIALHLASKSGREQMVRLLLTRGADVNAGIDCTALICAATQLHTDVVVCLLEAGADLDWRVIQQLE